jgi:hypothetical protein
MDSKLTTQNPKPSPVEQEATGRWIGSWRRLYGLVLAELAILIVLFYLFTKAFE